jgi:hypothetical protein
MGKELSRLENLWVSRIYLLELVTKKKKYFITLTQSCRRQRANSVLVINVTALIEDALFKEFLSS